MSSQRTAPRTDCIRLDSESNNEVFNRTYFGFEKTKSSSEWMSLWWLLSTSLLFSSLNRSEDKRSDWSSVSWSTATLWWSLVIRNAAASNWCGLIFRIKDLSSCSNSSRLWVDFERIFEGTRELLVSDPESPDKERNCEWFTNDRWVDIFWSEAFNVADSAEIEVAIGWEHCGKLVWEVSRSSIWRS